MKKTLLLIILFCFSLPAIADSTVPVAQFTIGFGDEIEMQEIFLLGFRAGADYAINAVEEENRKWTKLEISAVVIVAAALAYVVASKANDKQWGRAPCVAPPGAVCY